jgi:hypothetical protein
MLQPINAGRRAADPAGVAAETPLLDVMVATPLLDAVLESMWAHLVALLSTTQLARLGAICLTAPLPSAPANATKKLGSDEVPLHVPGQKRGRGVHPKLREALAGGGALACDLTELAGLDFMSLLDKVDSTIYYYSNYVEEGPRRAMSTGSAARHSWHRRLRRRSARAMHSLPQRSACRCRTAWAECAELL